MTSLASLLANFTHADGAASRALELAEKAMSDGKFEKGIGYGLIALVYQLRAEEWGRDLERIS